MNKNYKIFKFNVLTLIGSLLFFSNCFGATIYVNNTATTGDVYCTAVGNNANSGLTPALPKLTVAAAIGVASAGDIIYVDTGTYGDDTIPINKAVTIIGAGTGNTIFNNGDAAQVWGNITSSNVTVKNMTMTRYSNASGSSGQVLNINGAYTNITLDGILLTASLGASSTLPNINISGGASVTLKNSFFKCSGYNGSMGGGILVNASTAVIENTVFYQNESATATENGGGLQLKGNANVTVTNCTFNGCVSLKGGAIGMQGGTLNVTGSCFSDNFSETDDNTSGGGAIFVTGTITGCTISNCSFFRNAATAQSKGSTSIVAGTAASADGAALCFKSVAGTVSVTNCSFSDNGKIKEVASGGVLGNVVVNSFDDGQDIYYSGASLNITISNNSFSTANSGEVNIYEDGSGNQTMSNNGIYTHFGSTGTTVSSLLTTRRDVNGANATGWTDNHLTGGITINMIGSLLTPIRTGVFSTCSTTVFAGWTDTNVTQSGACSNTIGGVGYIALNTATSSTISPAMDFTTSTASKYLTFKAIRHSSVNAAKNIVTVSISTNNGSSWILLGTRTTASTTLTQMTPFDLSAYSGTQVKIKFESLTADGIIGIGIDDISITNASNTITPSMNFSNKGVQVTYTTALIGTISTTYQQVKVSISQDNGATWTAVNTTTAAGTYTLDLSAYHSTTTKIKFETPYGNGTTGASIDNLIFNSAASSNTSPVTSCQNPSSISGCSVSINCATETQPPVILRCVENKTITDCSGTLTDYRSELSAYDDCSFTISQSPAPGTSLATLGNGTHTITFTVSDQSTFSPDTTCTMVLTLSGCAGCSVKTWTGSTWSPTGTPTIANEVVIDDTYNTTNHGNIECCKLTVNSGKTLTVTSDMYAYVINEVVNNGTFTIENNGSLVQEAEGKTNTGNLIYKRITKQRNSDYVYWSSPVANYALANHITTGPKYIWNTTAPNANGTQGTWVGAPATLDLAQGVIVRGNANFNDFTTTINNYENIFTGVPNNGAVTRSVFRGNLQGSGTTSGGATITAIDDNYNLIGNPYPSSISAKDFLIENNSVLTGAIAIWTHGTLIGNNNQSFYQNFTYTYSSNNYNFYNLSGSVFSPGTDYYIGAGQGFFVTMIDDITASSGNVTFKNTMRSKNYTNSSTASTPNFFRSASNNATSTNATLSHKLWIDIVGQNGSSSRTLVAYTKGATNQKDNLFDAITKPQNDLLFYSLLDQDRLVIQGKALPFDVSDQVPMGYFAPTAGNYTLALAFVEGTFNNGQVIYVKDNLLNSYHNLSESAYTFTTVAGENQNRFVIVYQTLLNNEHFNSSQVNIIINDFIHIESKENMQNIEIYDMLGKLIKNYSNVNTTFWKESFNYANGVYLVKITTQDKTTISQKVIK